MLSEEEKQAIEYVKSLIELFDSGVPLNYLEQENENLKLFLNLIEKLQEENEVLKRALDKETADRSNDLLELQKKDKIIDLMAKEILYIDKSRSEYIYDKPRIWMTEEEIKDYYERKATNDG